MKYLSRLTAGVPATLLLAACAAAPAPEYSRAHPANPDAPQVSAPTAPSALDAYRAGSARKNAPSATPAEESNPLPANGGQPVEHRHEH